MYWTDSNAAVRCFLDSRCIRPEDYVPHWNESYRLPEVEGETGVLPAWRVFGVNFVRLVRRSVLTSSGALDRKSTTASPKTSAATGDNATTKTGHTTSSGTNGSLRASSSIVV